MLLELHRGVAEKWAGRALDVLARVVRQSADLVSALGESALYKRGAGQSAARSCAAELPSVAAVLRGRLELPVWLTGLRLAALQPPARKLERQAARLAQRRHPEA